MEEGKMICSFLKTDFLLLFCLAVLKSDLPFPIFLSSPSFFGILLFLLSFWETNSSFFPSRLFLFLLFC